MQEGQPIQFERLLPAGMTIDDALILVAALGVFMIIWSLGQWFITRDRLGPRLKAIQERRQELKEGLLTPRRRSKNLSGTLPTIKRIVARLKLLQQHQIDILQRKLVQAGYRSKDAVFVFAFAKLLSPFLGLAAGFLLGGGDIDWAHPFRTDTLTSWLIILGTAYAFSRLPELLVHNKRGKRYDAIRKALPDGLDLMMICAEAGLSLSASLDRVARELGRVRPELGEEFSLTSVELGFLPDRATALKHLAERCDLPEIRGFVNVIVQTEKYGTPIAQALRVLSKEYREERMLRAEQKAARLPALMTVPMIVFILPTLFVIIMTPAIISVMNSF